MEGGDYKAAASQLIDDLYDYKEGQSGSHVIKASGTRHLLALSSIESDNEPVPLLHAPGVQAMADRTPKMDRPTKSGPIQSADPGATARPLVPPGPDAVTTIEYQGRFTLLAPHARGGLGEVFIAHDEGLDRQVALKRLLERHAEHPESRRRFLIEAEITARLEHPGIVPVYALTHDAEGQPCYTMRFIEGETFQQAIERFHAPNADKETRGQGDKGNKHGVSPCPLVPLSFDSLEFRQLLQRFIAVCQTMAYAHSRGVIHRDLKPANIMIGPYGETLVVDWGLAKVISGSCVAAPERTEEARGLAATTDYTLRTADEGATKMGAAVGTPPFMSPEQAAGRWDVVGPASDIYNLGATLSLLLTGRTPIHGRDEYEILQKIQRGDYPRPRQVRPEIPRALEAVCLKAMALRPEDRYVSATALAQDLERWLAGEPVSAYQEPIALKCRRWIKRHRTAVASAAAAVLAALVLGGSIGLWLQWQRSKTLQAAEATLAEGRRQLERGEWGDARATLERAEALLGSAAVEHLHQGVQQIRTALRLVATLDEIHLQEPNVGPDQVIRRRPGEAYEAAFRSAGLSVLEGDAAILVERLRSSAISRELVSALDRWSAYAEDDAQQQRLRDLARRADPDAVRNQVRDALAQKDQDALKNLAGRIEVAALPPITVVLLAEALEDEKAKEAMLKAAQRQHPDDFWINHDLAVCLRTQKPPRTAEALGFYRAALALRPQSHITHYNLGVALRADRQSVEAEAAFRKTIELQPLFAMAHNNLGAALLDQGKHDEAGTAFRQALELKPDLITAHQNLAILVMFRKDYSEAERVIRKALGYAPESTVLQDYLGEVLGHLNRDAEAAAVYQELCRLEPANPKHHYNRGCMLEAISKDQEALAAYEQAIALKPDFAKALCNRAVVLAKLGRRADAIAAYRQALSIQPEDAIAYYGLGRVLCNDGQFAESLTALRRALELGPKDQSWQYRLANDPSWNDTVNGWVRRAERGVELDRKLSRLLRNQEKPADPTEMLVLADLCRKDYRRLYATATGLYAEAFVARPELAERIDAGLRYNAACSAALAGCGQGEDAAKLSEAERARWRQQALEWLRADLRLWSDKLKVGSADRTTVQSTLQHWQQDADLSGVRDAEQLSKLPAEDEAAWKQFWSEVGEVLKRARGG